MTWHLSGAWWELHRDGSTVDALRWDDAQHVYVDLKGRPLSRSFDDARRICEDRTGPAKRRHA